jgi:ferredoxin
MVVELTGEQKNYDKGVQYLIDCGVRIQSLSQDVTRNEERCTSCGACVTVCPAGAFDHEPSTMIVRFNNAKCVACGLCIKACPPRAMELHF